jgi:hypothetical protein
MLVKSERYKMTLNKYVMVTALTMSGIAFAETDLNDQELTKKYSKASSDYVNAFYAYRTASDAWVKCINQKKLALCEDVVGACGDGQRITELWNSAMMASGKVIDIEREVRQKSGTPMESFLDSEKVSEALMMLYRQDKLQNKSVEELKEKNQRNYEKRSSSKRDFKLQAIKAELKERASSQK